MENHPKTSNLKSIFLLDTPLLDVRAPQEFCLGAFNNSTNKPILTDQERHLVGIEYKKNGQQSAINLGYKLIDKKEKEVRIHNWLVFFKENPNGVIYCFRGGLRSKLTQKMLAESGLIVPRVIGGYKAMRRFLIDVLDQESKSSHFIIIGGRTGVGKTELLKLFNLSINLEEIAQHRGSAFGQLLLPQPSQINIENNLAVSLLKTNHKENKFPIFIEDEGGKIGGRCIPLSFYESTKKAPLVILEDSLENRINRVFFDYIKEPINLWSKKLGSVDEAQKLLTNRIENGLNAIANRLGGLRHRELKNLAKEGLVNFFNSEDKFFLNCLIERLLVYYYDPMYDYQTKMKSDRIIFRGEKDDIHNWAINNGFSV